MKKTNLTNWLKKKRFDGLVQEYLDNLYQLAYMRCQDKELAEDLVQDTCIKAFNSYMTKDKIENPKAWLFRILVNTHIDYTRKKQFNVVDMENFEFPQSDNTSKQAESNAFYNDLTKALNKLDEQQRTVVYLSDVQEYSYKEIAGMLEIPIGTVMSRLHRARQSLRKILSKEGYSVSAVKSGGKS